MWRGGGGGGGGGGGWCGGETAFDVQTSEKRKKQDWKRTVVGRESDRWQERRQCVRDQLGQPLRVKECQKRRGRQTAVAQSVL